nr:MAG TPA: hypothetical protein [Caudoviricetes sp.]
MIITALLILSPFVGIRFCIKLTKIVNLWYDYILLQ